jgi:hypothetical protein
MQDNHLAARSDAQQRRAVGRGPRAAKGVYRTPYRRKGRNGKGLASRQILRLHPKVSP